jgi:flavin reductase (DIM6/NTAB) family NADH-FMN oxidoreductase RutF
MIEPDRFRRVLGQVPTPITVVTACTPHGPAGLSIGSFVSISLQPPLVGIFVAEQSTSWPLIAAVGSFTINVLGYDQQELCPRFATSGGDKFHGLQWRPSPGGHPLLSGVAAWLDCRLVEERKIGDHVLAVGLVVDLGDAAGVHPLVFHRGSLRRLAHAS